VVVSEVKSLRVKLPRRQTKSVSRLFRRRRRPRRRSMPSGSLPARSAKSTN
jgi:hypothetical protein